MSLAIVFSRASSGIAAPLVTVETHIARGLPQFNIVGLPETVVKESKYRVRSALLNTQFSFPRGRITVNLAPADLPKEGGRFDLPIAIGILAASEQISRSLLQDFEFAGELALSGDIRRVQGVLPIVIGAKREQRSIFIPAANAAEASFVNHPSLFGAEHLLEVCSHLNAIKLLPACELQNVLDQDLTIADMADVKGQPMARRALEIAAAGMHSLLLVGPPGAGKTMLASRLPSILPSLTEDEALDVAALASISSSGFKAKQWRRLPFRAPHHTSSSVALVGGGRPPKPGEISLAHRGVLFLDELTEFNRQVLESLREPLESHTITISRASFQTCYPAEFQLVGAMNPCPCGYAGCNKQLCRCSDEQIHRYMAKISGPLLDRVDMQVSVQGLSAKALRDERPEEPSAAIKLRVLAARDFQQQRQGKCNARLSVNELKRHCPLDQSAEKLLSQMMDKFQFSARVFHRLLKLARTVADLDGAENITTMHISEALSYRWLDRSKT